MSGGVAWAIAAAIGFGIFQTMNRKAGETLDALRGTFILIMVSSVMLLLGAIFTANVNIIEVITWRAVFWFSLAGFIHFFVGWWILAISQEEIGAARTGAVLGTMPVFGLIIDLTLYREPFSWATVIGVALVVAGVYLISLR
ncbi:MAG: DMT family transporter [Chloroflexota bacterium]